MLRFFLTVAVLLFPPSAAVGSDRIISGNWSLAPEVAGSSYVLASRGTPGSYLICFKSGTVREIVVSVGDERSHVARGSCTVFLPTVEDGIVVDFVRGAPERLMHAVALGTFEVILPPVEQLP